MEALEALDEAGYENIVALKGGYYAWFRCWDNNLRRRRGDGYTEVRRRVFRTLFSEGAEGGGREERAVREKEVAVEGRLDGFLTRSIDRNRRMLLRLFSENAKTPSSRSK
jgi:hypothetical protein